MLPGLSVKVARDAIHSLIQARSVQEDIGRFQTLVLQIPDMNVAEQLDEFTAGFKLVIYEKAEIEGCTTLADAMRVAQRIDAIHHRHQHQLERSAASLSS